MTSLYTVYIKKSFLFVFLCLSCTLQAQEFLENIFKSETVSNSVLFTVGYEPDGFLIRGGYSRGFDQHILSATVQANFEQYSVGFFDENVNAQQYLLNLGYHYEFLEINGRDFVFSGGGGILVGYENVPTTILRDGGVIESQSGAIFGGFVGITAEKYLLAIDRTNVLSLLLDIRHNYFIQSELGAQQFNAAIGARYTF